MAVVDGKIRCSACRQWKELDAFIPSVRRRGSGTCRTCKYIAKQDYCRRNRAKVNAAKKRYRDANIEHHRALARQRNRRNPDRLHAYNLRRYGITRHEYYQMLADQEGRCACCGAPENTDGRRLFVDHDHETNQVRGLLCYNCNTGIGALGDTIEGLWRAIAYLRRSRKHPHLKLVK